MNIMERIWAENFNELKVKVSSLDIAPLTIQRRFTTLEVAADWHRL